MRILHVISSLDKGGAETHLAMMLKAHSQKNNVIKVIYFKGNGFWKKDINSFLIKTKLIKFEKLSNLYFLIKTYFLLKIEILKFRPDIIHAHLSSSEFLISLLKFFNNKVFKFVITKHLDSFFLEGSNRKNLFFRGLLIDKFIFDQADHIIFISKHTKKFFEKKIKINYKKKSLIYYGLEKSFYKNTFNFKKKINKVLGFKKNKNCLVISNVSRHVKQKSIDTLLEALNILKKKYFINIKLLLVGTGPDTKNLKKLAERLDLKKNIVWIDHYTNIKDIYDYSDLFVLTSTYEGLGLVLLEAMQSSLPIIAASISSIPEIVRQNKNGFLVKKHSAKNFAKQIFKFIKKKRTFNQSKKILNESFNYNYMCQKTYKIYKDLV